MSKALKSGQYYNFRMEIKRTISNLQDFLLKCISISLSDLFVRNLVISHHNKLSEVLSRNSLIDGVIAFRKGFGERNRTVGIPFKLEAKNFSVFRFHIINLLLLFGAPEILRSNLLLINE